MVPRNGWSLHPFTDRETEVCGGEGNPLQLTRKWELQGLENIILTRQIYVIFVYAVEYCFSCVRVCYICLCCIF